MQRQTWGPGKGCQLGSQEIPGLAQTKSRLPCFTMNPLGPSEVSTRPLPPPQPPPPQRPDSDIRFWRRTGYPVFIRSLGGRLPIVTDYKYLPLPTPVPAAPPQEGNLGTWESVQGAMRAGGAARVRQKRSEEQLFADRVTATDPGKVLQLAKSERKSSKDTQS